MSSQVIFEISREHWCVAAAGHLTTVCETEWLGSSQSASFEGVAYPLSPEPSAIVCCAVLPHDTTPAPGLTVALTGPGTDMLQGRGRQ